MEKIKHGGNWFGMAFSREGGASSHGWLCMTDCTLEAEESVSHLWFSCLLAAVWPTKCSLGLVLDIKLLVWFGLNSNSKGLIFQSKLLVINAVVYFIWHARNQVIHDGVYTSVEGCVGMIIKECKERIFVKEKGKNVKERAWIDMLLRWPFCIVTVNLYLVHFFCNHVSHYWVTSLRGIYILTFSETKKKRRMEKKKISKKKNVCRRQRTRSVWGKTTWVC